MSRVRKIKPVCIASKPLQKPSKNGQFKRDLKEENQTRVSFALVMIGTLKQRALPSTKRKVNGSSIFMNSILAGLPLKG